MQVTKQEFERILDNKFRVFSAMTVEGCNAEIKTENDFLRMVIGNNDLRVQTDIIQDGNLVVIKEDGEMWSCEGNIQNILNCAKEMAHKNYAEELECIISNTTTS